jgi:multicomponent Na+:H+ antiporter subunit E
LRFVLTWILLAAFWIGLSGYFDAIHLTWGLVAVTLVSVVSARAPREGPSVGTEVGQVLRLFAYVPWLLWQIALANWDVALRVLGVRPVDPRVVRFRPGLQSDFGRVAMANSITLTPGTVTIEVEEDGAFLVHAIAPPAEEALLDGAMAARVRRVEGPTT